MKGNRLLKRKKKENVINYNYHGALFKILTWIFYSLIKDSTMILSVKLDQQE